MRKAAVGEEGAIAGIALDAVLERRLVLCRIAVNPGVGTITDSGVAKSDAALPKTELEGEINGASLGTSAFDEHTGATELYAVA